jgi:hypothetical protein
MGVEVINIKKEHEIILGFLYPNYTIIKDSLYLSDDFIINKDIKSRTEREYLDVRFNNCLVISTMLFDEFWNEEVLEQKALEFARVHFKSRKKTISIDHDDNFIENLLNFMFLQNDEEESKEIFRLFDSFGSKTFNSVFLELSTEVPVPVLIASFNTFIYKILNVSNQTVYYKKKSLLFGEKIKANLIKGS